MNSKIRLIVDDKQIVSKQAIIPPGLDKNPSKWVCPVCKRPKARRKPVCDVIQYGFEWDSVTTVMQCTCGAQFHSTYKNWHVESEQVS